MTGLIDTHCHLTAPTLADDIDGVLDRARAVGVTGFVATSTDLTDAYAVTRLSGLYDNVYGAIGVHPLWTRLSIDMDTLAAMARSTDAKVVAIGEIGLDRTQGAPDMAIQEMVFTRQVALARDLGLPVIVHCRNAFDRVATILESFGGDGPGGIIHAYGGSIESMTRLHKLGFKRGVGGGVTHEGSRRTREAVAATALENIVLETDSPWIGTASKRKGHSEPADIVEVIAAVAGLHDQPVADVAEIVTGTTRRLLKI